MSCLIVIFEKATKSEIIVCYKLKVALHGLNISFLSLKHRQEQWKKDEAERIANTPDPSVPEGHRVLPENERRDTLALLRKSKLFIRG